MERVSHVNKSHSIDNIVKDIVTALYGDKEQGLAKLPLSPHLCVTLDEFPCLSDTDRIKVSCVTGLGDHMWS